MKSIDKTEHPFYTMSRVLVRAYIAHISNRDSRRAGEFRLPRPRRSPSLYVNNNVTVQAEANVVGIEPSQ
jgi:hypothetical protein